MNYRKGLLGWLASGLEHRGTLTGGGSTPHPSAKFGRLAELVMQRIANPYTRLWCDGSSPSPTAMTPRTHDLIGYIGSYLLTVFTLNAILFIVTEGI